jgi:succinoglycan biosynthesis transport protein ExoP
LINSRPNLPMAAAEPEVTLPAAGYEESTQGGMSMAQVICILRAYWLKSLITFFALVVVMFVGIKLMPKVFVATVTLIVNLDNKDPLAAREFAGGGAQTASYVPTQIELIMSRVVLQPVVDRLKLTKNLHDVLQVQQGINSQLLYISASAKTPDRAAQLANAVADEYLKQERQRTNQPAGARAERYAKQLQELREKAIAAQDRVTEFRHQNGMTEIESNITDIEGAALADLQQKLEAAQNQRREIEGRQLGAHADSTSVLDSNAVIALRSSLATQEARMAELRATLGPKHPRVIELESQMAATRRSLAGEVQSISASNGLQLARARELEAKYQAAVNAERNRLLERRGLQDQGAKLLLELQSAQATYKKALDGYDQIVFASAGDYSDVSLISRADPPAKPEKPNKLKWFLMSCVLSLGLALAVPFGYELLLNRRLRCRDDLERHFGIPVLVQLGPIPSTQS